MESINHRDLSCPIDLSAIIAVTDFIFAHTSLIEQLSHAYWGRSAPILGCASFISAAWTKSAPRVRFSTAIRAITDVKWRSRLT
jgi:hypothetical protein